MTIDDIQEFIAFSSAREEAEQERIRRTELRKKSVFNFSYQRTPLQALGWYIAFLVIGLFSSVIIGFAMSRGSTFAEGFESTYGGGQILGFVYTIILGALLLWKKQKGAASILLFLSAIATGLFGIFAGLLPLAILTTRPPTKSYLRD
jgi:hypothetical protein